jgi:DNA polymerase delta subunit 1
MGDIKKNHNLKSYSLDGCAEHFLKGERKADLKAQEQFDCYRSNQVGTLLEYCIQDVNVTYQLAEKLSCLPTMIETAAIAWVTPTMIATRGQQIRVYSCIKIELYERAANFFLRDTKDDPPGEGGYKGATVLEPDKGFYPRCIVSLDFASLYPTIMVGKGRSLGISD